MIRVHTPDQTQDDYADGTKWHIDEIQMLHVLTNVKRGLATYAPTHWSSVRIID